MMLRVRLRAPGTRTMRRDPRQRRLESLAAEFALLTARRARTLHQIEMLDRQRAAAADTLHKVVNRLGWLLQHIEAFDPDLCGLAALAVPEPEPEPPPPPPPQARVLAADARRSSAAAAKATGAKLPTARPWGLQHPGRPAGVKWRSLS